MHLNNLGKVKEEEEKTNNTTLQNEEIKEVQNAEEVQDKNSRIYTAEEYQKGIDKAIANRFKDFPTSEELEEFKKWKSSQSKNGTTSQDKETEKEVEEDKEEKKETKEVKETKKEDEVTEESKKENKENNISDLQKENEKIKKLLILAKKGITGTKADFIVYNLENSKDFETDLDVFLNDESNNFLLNKTTNSKTGVHTNNNSKFIENDPVFNILRSKHPDLYK